MTNEELIHAKEARQVELLTIMSKSDAHAVKCAKLGLVFAEEYPEDYAVYCAAREEYNSNEREIEEAKSATVEEEPIEPIEE